MRLLPQDYLNFYMQAIYVQRERGSRWFNWIILGLATLLFCLLGFLSGDWATAIAFGAGVPILLLIVTWWTYFIRSAILQNSPRNTHLIPRLRQRLVQATILLWAGFNAIFAALLACGVGHFALNFVATGLMLILIAATQIPRFGFYLCAFFFIWVNLPPITRLLNRAWIRQFLLSGEGAIAGAILIMALGIFVIHRIFQQGTSRHWKEYEKMRLVVGEIGSESDRKKSSSIGPFGHRFLNVLNGYASLLRPNELQSMSPIGRVLLSLGPAFRGREVIVGGIGITLLALAGLALAKWQLIHLSASELRSVKVPAAMYCVVLIFGFVQQIINSIYRTRPEQALIRLTPTAPATNAFNKALYPALLKRFLLVWAALCACGTISFMLLDGTTENLLQVISFCTAYLLLAPCLVKNYASMRPPESSSMLVGVAFAIHAIIGIFICVHYFVYPVPWSALGIFSITTATIVVLLKFRKMEHAPAAFPAGRLT